MSGVKLWQGRPGAWWRKEARRNDRGPGPPHLVPYHFLIPLDILHDLQYDLACHVPWHRQSRGIPRGEGERSGG